MKLCIFKHIKVRLVKGNQERRGSVFRKMILFDRFVYRELNYLLFGEGVGDEDAVNVHV